MNRDRVLGSNQSTPGRSKQRRSVITRHSSGRTEKSASLTKNRQTKKRFNIRQAIDEALDDYSAEHLDEYSLNQSELVVVSPVSQKPSGEEREQLETKRRHSFDIQTSKSPVLVAKKHTELADSLSLLEPLSGAKETAKQGPTGRTERKR